MMASRCSRRVRRCSCAARAPCCATPPTALPASRLPARWEEAGRLALLGCLCDGGCFCFCYCCCRCLCWLCRPQHYTPMITICCCCLLRLLQEATFEYDELQAALRFELPAGASAAAAKAVTIQF